MADFDLYELQERLAELSPMPGLPVAAAPAAGTGMFSGFRDRGPGTALTTTVHEGGGEGLNRWQAFNEATGSFIRMARRGVNGFTLTDAKIEAHAWMVARMAPPWPESRFEQEFGGLLAHDIDRNGSWPEARPAPPLVALGKAPEHATEAWDVGVWVPDETPPPRIHLIEGVLFGGVPQMFASAPGVGKTTLMLDMALKLAYHQPGDGLEWLGQKVTDHAGGPVVLYTTEDNYREIRIRLYEIDAMKLRFRAKNRLFVVPTVDAGGSFTLVERDTRNGAAVPSRMWEHRMGELAEIQRKHGQLVAVMVDTFSSTMHGNENDSTTVNEYMRQASRVCGEFGAAFLLSHHTRKAGKDPIKTAQDMADSVRGSSASLGHTRAATGLWEDHDWARKLKEMRLAQRPGRLYRFGVIKRNNPETLRDVKTLLRDDATGMLVDVTTKDPDRLSRRKEKIAWLVAAVRLAVAAEHPFGIHSKTNGIYAQRGWMPPIIQDLGTREDMVKLAEDALADGAVVQCKVGNAKAAGPLDVPFGRLANKQLSVDAGAWSTSLTIDWASYSYDPTTESVTGPGLPPLDQHATTDTAQRPQETPE